MSDTIHDVLDAAEAGALLRLDPAAVVACCEAGELPGRKLAGTWRLSRGAVLAYLAGDGQATAPATPEPAPVPTIDPKAFEASLRARLQAVVTQERTR